ncbi:HAMP domain-containing histidine kinase [Marivirga sp. S37H4]|uniref:histidine kinase n=1 Tax=Marivirga aurantiaca TaxID=2802615 RepID=A0A935C7Z7_9BACT|nr:HAMP domain-containing sensor histidine kinase [Marivirga aurantiaca]MBK6265225.1 HAMP domain-containing histidine kinase [Marivirga aurantiaca]
MKIENFPLNKNILRESPEKEGHCVRQLAQLKNENKMLKEASYLTAHDLKSPLNAIEGLIELLHFDFPNHENHTLDKLRFTVHHMKDFVEDMLAQASVGNVLTPTSEIYLGQLVREIVEADQLEKKLMLQLPEIWPVVTAPKALLQTIFRNLLTNAISHSDKGICKVQIVIKEFAHKYMISFSDNGPGMDEDSIERLMFPFQKGEHSANGHGVGLYAVKNALQLMGETFNVHSEPGRGTEFIFSLQK